MVTREVNECRVGFTGACGCELLKLALLLGLFQGWGKRDEGYSKTLPSRQPLRE